MTEEWMRAWGTAICALLAIGFVIGTLMMISHPSYAPWGWLGVILDGALLVLMWESVKKIGEKP